MALNDCIAARRWNYDATMSVSVSVSMHEMKTVHRFHLIHIEMKIVANALRNQEMNISGAFVYRWACRYIFPLSATLYVMFVYWSRLHT